MERILCHWTKECQGSSFAYAVRQSGGLSQRYILASVIGTASKKYKRPYLQEFSKNMRPARLGNSAWSFCVASIRLGRSVVVFAWSSTRLYQPTFPVPLEFSSFLSDVNGYLCVGNVYLIEFLIGKTLHSRSTFLFEYVLNNFHW